MSVENQAGEQDIAVKHEETQKPSNMHNPSSNISETMEKLPTSTSTSPVPIISNFTEKESSLTKKNDARDWMETMDAVERTCALVFVDGSFLAALLTFASWSKSPSTPSGGTSEQIDWTAIVDIDAFINTIHGRVNRILSQPRAEKEEKVATNYTSLTDATSEKREFNELVDSNALRIRDKDISNEEESCALGDINLISRILNDTCLVFPSAFRQVDSYFTDEKSPAVVVTHRFDLTDWQQAFRSLDQVFTHFFGSGFLSNVDFTHKSAESLLISRLELLKKTYARVPLALILLIRLEVAAIFSFKGETCLRHDPSPGLMTRLSQLLSNVTISNTHDISCMGPFLTAFCIPSEFSVDMSSLLLTPLGLLSFAKRNTLGYNWADLDHAIGSSLLKIETSVPVDQVNSSRLSNGIELKQDQAPHSVGPTSNTEGGVPVQQKKKRKSRKRKGVKKISQIEKGVTESGDSETVDENADVAETTPEIPLIDSKVVVLGSSFQASARLDKFEVAEPTDVSATLVSSTTSLSTDLDQVLSVCNSNDKDASETRSEIASPESLALPATRDVECEEGDEDVWERVQVRGRGNRRKGADQQLGTPKNRSHSGVPDGLGGSKKTKGARSVASRKKVANRKVAKDILSSVLDKVEDEVQSKKATGSKQAVNPWKVSNDVQSTRIDTKVQPHASTSKTAPSQEKTLRDILLGSKETSSSAKQPSGAPNNGGLVRKDQNARTKVVSNKPDKDITLADQNTAPTYQETVSAVSTPSNIATKVDRNSSEERASKSDSSVDETTETPPNNGRLVTQPKPGAGTDDPPLPTLLNPENANSTTSSVASSLEIPSGCHRHHAGNGDVNDVGYHLLDVCDQLSRDMCLFMSRRALALGARRRERGAILYALQDMLSRIWPNSCHVEMYGSCATQLDLPSSDIDVVIMGLDRNQNMMLRAAPPLPATNNTPSHSSPNKLKSSNTSVGDINVSSSNGLHTKAQVQHHQIHPYPPFIPLPIQSNADRVRRLAAELELQPWAVQVNAIPNASVPVVKVLCDPSRLGGGSNTGDWMTHDQRLSADTAAAAGHSRKDGTKDEDPGSAPQLTSPPHSMLPWRGSDVMNGLLKLDITFEGPEHGGIGSTQFSARVVNDACQHANVHPDATPLVQVVMVLKELLVQRKLNEPYSGGLSSYALLLLVVALLREREVIRKEIERVELQRKAMTDIPTGDSKVDSQTYLKSVHQSITRDSRKMKGIASLGNQVPKVLTDSPNEKGTTNGAGKSTGTNGYVPSGSSSWASVAKKNPKPASSRPHDSVGKPIGDSTSAVRESSKEKMKATFADAVSKPAVSTSAMNKKVSGVDVKNSRSASHPAAEDSARSMKLNDKRVRTSTSASLIHETNNSIRSISKDEETKSMAQSKTERESIDSSIIQGSPYFAQGFNDIVEVLCSGDTTAGKLLMHFLLYYGEHFDAQSTAIDISGKHERSFSNHLLPYAHISPYIQRRAHGSIDPITGMLTIDPIVIFDPLEGAENSNVARRCFAWTSVRWIFAQSYNTLSSAVERSASPTTPSAKHPAEIRGDTNDTKPRASSTVSSDVSNDPTDPSSSLLRCLLSF